MYPILSLMVSLAVFLAVLVISVTVWTGILILLLLSWDDPAEFRRLQQRWLHWISRSLLVSGSLAIIAGTVVSAPALHSPTLMRLLDPVFDGVVNDSLGLAPVCKIGALVCVVGAALAWWEGRTARVGHWEHLRSRRN